MVLSLWRDSSDGARPLSRAAAATWQETQKWGLRCEQAEAWMIRAHPESCTLGGLLTAATARSQPATLQDQMASLQVCLLPPLWCEDAAHSRAGRQQPEGGTSLELGGGSPCLYLGHISGILGQL